MKTMELYRKRVSSRTFEANLRTVKLTVIHDPRPGLSAKEVATAMGVSLGLVTPVLKALVARGELEQFETQAFKAGRYYKVKTYRGVSLKPAREVHVPTVLEVAEMHLVDRQFRSQSEVAFRNFARNLADSFGGDFPITDLTYDLAEEWIREARTRKSWSPRRSTVRALINFAYSRGFVEKPYPNLVRDGSHVARTRGKYHGLTRGKATTSTVEAPRGFFAWLFDPYR